MQELAKHLRDGTHWGFFGGAFDPPHFGHIELSKALLTAENLDGVILAPTFHPPHKAEPTTSFAARIAMCQLVCENESRFVVSDIESQIPTPSYTVDVIAELLKRFPRVRFSILVGADNLQILASWRQIERLLQLAPMIVGSRPKYELKVKEEIDEAISDDLRELVRIVPSPLVDISSTKLRERFKSGESFPKDVNPSVCSYIKEHGLYR